MEKLLSNIDINIECTYMTKGAQMPFCKGCGHSHILRKLDEALLKLKLNPEDICLVTDIGCIGLADYLFDKVHTVHTTHGRSTAFATGIALADKVLASKKLKTIVLIGDGGAMIGLLHIVNAALLNTDVTVIVADNFLFGMTGGQQSAFSPIDFITQTSPLGNIIPPLDLCKVAVSSKAQYVARKISTDKDLVDTLTEAISYNGFSLVEVLELCTEYAVEKNKLKGTDLIKIAENHEHQLGVIENKKERKEFSVSYIEKFFKSESDFNLFTNFISPDQNTIDFNSKFGVDQIGIIISGSAGEKVQSSAAMLCQAAAQSGLFTTQKNDNPVTQGSGFSLSEVILSPDEIYYTGVDSPFAIIVVSIDGLKELKSQNIFEKVNDGTIIIYDESLDLPVQTKKMYKLPLRKLCGPDRAALGGIDVLLNLIEPFPLKNFHSLIEKRFGDYPKIYKGDLIGMLRSN
ncbi:MAG: thiamine pyrophosphate-dependent enzyme [Ignavibacteria bacterium]|jgi:pyruvate/2-oxoacid:ferredoxin oxidoreductase beta subunit|nr:thiamine pyrophosphate-dependent enzyme [Ignavibacteria bacterium]MDH7527511.1 thiamine pyrophosphate-dependent enzyme [Ignavibacteria bacterium]